MMNLTTAAATATVLARGTMPTKMMCIVRPCQSGKTRTMQEKMQDMERLARERNVDGDGYLNILITSNNRALVSATKLRMDSIHSPGSVDSDDSFSDTESVELSDDKIVGSAFSWMSGTKYRTNTGDLADKIKEGDVRMVVCCAHKKRIGYIVELLENLDKSKLFKQQINVWFDEADAYVKLLTTPELDMCRFKRVERVWLVSATFYSVVDYYGSIRVEPANKSHPDCYVGISDCEIVLNDYKCKTSADYVDHVVSARADELCRPGVRLFTPGEITRKSHMAIAECLLSKGFAVAILNGMTKCVWVPSSTPNEPIVHNLSEYPPRVEEGVVVPESVGEMLARMYHELNLAAYPYSITGQMCLGRGLTFICGSADVDAPHPYPFQFDEEIVHPFIKDPADRYQCTARGVGNIGDFAGFTPPRMTMSTETRDSVLQSENIARRLAPFVLETGISEVGHAELDFAVHGDHVRYERDLAEDTAPPPAVVRKTVVYRVYTTEDAARGALKLLDPAYRWRTRGTNEAGFYEAAAGGPATVHTLGHVLKVLPNLTGGKGATATATRYVPCYTDVSRADSLRYVVIVPPAASAETLGLIDTQFASLHNSPALDGRGGGGGGQ